MGQNCCAASRLLIHEDIFDRMMDGLVRRVRALRIGDPMDERTDFGPLGMFRLHEIECGTNFFFHSSHYLTVNQEQFDKVLRYIDAAKVRGLPLSTGGRRWGDEGYFIEPTSTYHS